VLANLIYSALFNRFYVICKKIVYYPLIHYQPKWAQKACLCLDFAVFPVKPLNIANWIVSIGGLSSNPILSGLRRTSILFANTKLWNADQCRSRPHLSLSCRSEICSSKWHESATSSLQYRPSMAHFEPPRLHCERLRSHMATFWASITPEFFMLMRIRIQLFTLIRVRLYPKSFLRYI
jgi:hypothetical protein